MVTSTIFFKEYKKPIKVSLSDKLNKKLNTICAND